MEVRKFTDQKTYLSFEEAPFITFSFAVFMAQIEPSANTIQKKME